MATAMTADRPHYDAVIVGSGPNGLAAALVLASAGLSVLVLERAPEIGGGTRTAERTLPGFLHDVCSSVHPLAAAGPLFPRLGLEQHGLSWCEPTYAFAHPLDGGRAVVVSRDIRATAERFGTDARAYMRLFEPLARDFATLADVTLGPARVPRLGDLPPLARFGVRALRSARGLARAVFRTEEARAAFAGLSAHAILPLERSPSAAFGLVLGAAAHAAGWPVARGGSGRIADALAARIRALGGAIKTGVAVRSLGDLPPSRVVLLDITPRQFVSMASAKLSSRDRARYERFRYGPGVFKVDWALREPIPWSSPECRFAGTVHVGGTLDAIARAERDAFEGRVPESPFLILTQPTVADPTRAPPGQHTAWAYCHVPHGSDVDMTEAIESQIERFAPGFRDVVLARRTMAPADLEKYNPNYVGGDIGGGAATLGQLYTRPIARLVPYRTPLDGVFLCSSSTPPGGGVHGMCGFWAARAALRYLAGAPSSGLLFERGVAALGGPPRLPSAR
jgi:phytoene dehydrogenase-like protein